MITKQKRILVPLSLDELAIIDEGFDYLGDYLRELDEDAHYARRLRAVNVLAKRLDKLRRGSRAEADRLSALAELAR